MFGAAVLMTTAGEAPTQGHLGADLTGEVFSGTPEMPDRLGWELVDLVSRDLTDVVGVADGAVAVGEAGTIVSVGREGVTYEESGVSESLIGVTMDDSGRLWAAGETTVLSRRDDGKWYEVAFPAHIRPKAIDSGKYGLGVLGVDSDGFGLLAIRGETEWTLLPIGHMEGHFMVADLAMGPEVDEWTVVGSLDVVESNYAVTLSRCDRGDCRWPSRAGYGQTHRLLAVDQWSDGPAATSIAVGQNGTTYRLDEEARASDESIRPGMTPGSQRAVNLLGVAVVSPREAWAVGTAGSVGFLDPSLEFDPMPWRMGQVPEVQGDLRAVSFSGDGVGWAVGDGGVVLSRQSLHLFLPSCSRTFSPSG